MTQRDGLSRPEGSSWSQQSGDQGTGDTSYPKTGHLAISQGMFFLILWALCCHHEGSSRIDFSFTEAKKLELVLWRKCSVFCSVQSLSHVWLFATPWTAARQTSLSFISQSLLTLMSTESVTPSKHLILCRPLLLPLWIFPSIRVFSSELALPIKPWKFKDEDASIPFSHGPNAGAGNQ